MYCPLRINLKQAEEGDPYAPVAAGFTVLTTITSRRPLLSSFARGDVLLDTASKTGIPWGLTADQITRPNVDDGMCFNLCFPKTGSREDVDFCRCKRARGKDGFRAILNVRVLLKGDGVLIEMYPMARLINAELLLISAPLSRCQLGLIMLGTFGVATVIVADVTHDAV